MVSDQNQGELTERYFVGKSQVTVGRFTYGHTGLTIYNCGEGASLAIGSFCSLAWDIKFYLGCNHRVDWITTFPFGTTFKEELGGQGISGHPSTRGDVIVGNDVWIAAGSTIMSGVRIGDGAVVANGSLVTKDVAPYEIVAGNPARRVKNRFNDEIVELLLILSWWELPTEDIKAMTKILCSIPNRETLLSLIDIYRIKK